ncbi:MAG: 50S ribosomal protein L10 [Candidatus Levybacteria bacterium RIFCSPLOWO2_01_FULL_38_21]|nr:MAG: 50S ribosomal protein L10 [Candidatus Levybacteria bacterium RIFCSPLOWO2_01_FULL_38_21]
MNTKISKNREKKEQIVAKLSEKLAKAKALVFTNYQGLTHKQLEGLKKSLKVLNAEFIVTKNTLLRLALKMENARPAKLGRSGGKWKMENDEGLQNPTATLFVYDDVIMPLKQLTKSLKMLGLPTIKFGILDNQVLAGEQLLKLASLPSREVLLAQVVSGLKSPIFGLHRALSWNLQRLVFTLRAIETKKN